MTFLSLFSGCGGFDLSLERAGLRCVGQVEIDPYCRAVLARHWPDVPKWDDVRTLDGKRLKRPDVIAGGFPCQDVSVAGQRGGLAGERSGLFYQMVRVLRAMRPQYVLWENVGGLASSDGGRDFMRILSELARANYFGAVRRLDAQRYGVPQQRRRYFGLFARGHSGAERCAEILAVTESLRRHPAEGGEAGPRPAFSLTASVRRSSEGNRIGNAWNTNYVCGGNDTCGARAVASAVKCKTGRHGDFENENFVVQPYIVNAAESCARQSHARPADVARCLDQTGGFASSQGWTVVVYQCHGSNVGPMGHIEGHANGGGQVAVCVTGDRTHSLRSEGADASEDGTGRGTPIVAFAQNQRNEVRELGVAGALAAEPGMKQQTYLHTAGTVRRLTPRECERLMSWPDDWTRWKADGTEIKDGPRYRMIGNGVVANVAEWIGRRLMEADRAD